MLCNVMLCLTFFYRHKKRRALAKKMRRKRIRRALAQRRDELLQKGNSWQDIILVLSAQGNFELLNSTGRGRQRSAMRVRSAVMLSKKMLWHAAEPRNSVWLSFKTQSVYTFFAGI